MNSRLGLAATFSRCLSRMGIARVAASALTPVLLFQEEPPIWEIVGRFLAAFGKILLNWPVGTPINGASILLLVLKEANLVDVGAKFEEFLRTVTQAPPFEDTIFGQLYIAFIAIFGTLVLFYSVRYWATYNKVIREPNGEDRIWAGQAEIVNPILWGLRVVATIALIVLVPTLAQRLVINPTWNAINAGVQVFYTGYGTTISGAFVQLISKMAEGQGIFSFLVSFAFLFGFGAFVLLHYAKRFILFIWEHFLFSKEATKWVGGKREMTLAGPAKRYFERWLELTLTAAFFLLFPLLVLLIPGLEGLPVAAIIFVALYSAWKFPAWFVENKEEVYEKARRGITRRLYGEDEGTEEAASPGPQPPPQPSFPQRLGSLASELAKSDPNYQGAMAVAGAIQAIREHGPSQQALDSLDRSVGGLFSSRNPNAYVIRRIPPGLYERRNSLHSEKQVNDAIFAYLADTFAQKKPMRTLDELIRAASGEVEALKARSVESFTSLSRRGKQLKEAAEVENKDFPA